MSAASSESATSHICHCGKRFLRREHLRRHQATHGQPSFVCQTCQRSFTRSDILRRHTARHVTETIPKPRIQKACYACHSNKTKCDGGSPCSLCSKRGIECLYNRPSSISAAVPTELFAVAAQELFSSGPGTASDQNLHNNHSGLSSPPTAPGNVVKSAQVSQDAISSASIPGMRSVLEALNAPHGSLEELLEKSCGEPNAWSAACIDAYMEHFHCHWPVIHGPTFNLDRDPLAISASVIMIGCWLEYPKRADELIIAVHDMLVDKFFNELCKLKSGPRRDLPWDIEKYTAILLNIVFAFYSNREKIVTRGTMLLSLFIAELREIGLFSSEVAAYQMKTYFPGTFLPFVLSNREGRTRLVSCLFKIDTYLSLISGRRPSLQIEELRVNLTSTFSVWNAPGLDKFYRRYRQEPIGRAGVTIVDFLRRPDILDPSMWLVEDVHIGLCGMQWAVWRYNATRQNGGVIGPHTRDQLMKQLDFWKGKLDWISNLCNAQQLQTSEANLLLVYYLGCEREESPSTIRRVQSLIRDAKMLYNIFGLYLYSDTAMLSRFVMTPAAPLAETPDSSRSQEQNARIRDWALSVDGKKALSFCIAAIEAERSSLTKDKHQVRSPEPLSNAALSNGSVALSAWLQGPG